MFDIITIGSAMKDVFLTSKSIEISRTKMAAAGKGVLLALGSKVEVDDIILETGGGGTNTAVSFANLCLRTAFFGKTGKDSAGKHILDVLKENKVSTGLVLADKQRTTGYSTIISVRSGERVALVYRGANNFITKIPRFKARWVYLAPLSGMSLSIIPKIIKNKNFKIAMNPSSTYINRGIPKNILKNIDILLLNREEAARLTRVNFKDEKRIFKKLIHLTKGTVVMTEGEKGAMACDGKHIYKCNSPNVKVVNTLGAGDAFNSGFCYEIIKGNDIEKALKTGTLNAVSVIQELGAKKGLLKKGQLSKHKALMSRIKVRKGRI